MIESAYDDERRKKEERADLARRQKEESDRIALSRQREANAAFQDQAKREGFGDYTYTDDEGNLRSALTEEQTQTLRRENQLEEAEKAEQEAARFRERDVSRQLYQHRKTLLTDFKREEKKKDLAEKSQSLEMWAGELERGEVEQEEYDEAKRTLDADISKLNDELATDDANRAKAEELQQQEYMLQDLRDGRPQGLPRAVPDDPQERADFIEGYNNRFTRLQLERQAVSENMVRERGSYEARVNQVKERYRQWVGQGVSPAQQAEGERILSAEIGKATEQYLRGRFEFDQKAKKLGDEERELSLMRPFVMEADYAHKAWAKEQKEEALRIRREGIEAMVDQATSHGKEFSAFSYDAQKKMDEVARLIRSSEAKTPEEADALSRKVSQLQAEAQDAVSAELATRAENRQSLMEGLANRIGSDSILRMIAEKGYKREFANGKSHWKVPIVNDKRLGEEFETTGGNIIENVGGAVTQGGVNLGEWLFKTGYKALPGTQRVRSSFIRNFQEERGLSDLQMSQLLDDITKQYKEWNAEDTRTLSDGTVIFNPGLNLLDPAKYESAVKASGAPEFIKNHMLSEAVMDDYRHAYASTAAHEMESAAAMMIGVPTPSKWVLDRYGDGKRPDFSDWMAEYMEEHGLKDAPFWSGRSLQAFAARPLRSFAIGGGKMLQMFAGIGAVANIPGAADAAINLDFGIEEQRTGRDVAGGKIPIFSAITDTILEEGPSVLTTLPAGGVGGRVGGALAKSTVVTSAVKRGILPEVIKSQLKTQGALAGMSISSGLQSMGLSWTQYYKTTLADREKELGRALSDEEMDELIHSEAVQGRAVAAGLLTATITRAFGATGIESMWTKNKTFTVRDFWRSLKREGLSSEQKWKRAKSALLDIAKASGMEAAEEAVDEFMATLAFDSEATLEDALKAGWMAGKAGAILGGAIKTATSMRSTGSTAENFANPAEALEALRDTYGNDIDFTQGDVEAGLELIGTDPSRGTKDGGIAARNLRTAIETRTQLDSQEAEAIDSLEKATDAGDTDGVARAQRALDNTRQARGILKVANGTAVQDLTAAEQKAVRQNTLDGVPILDEVNGEVVITDAAITKLARQFPDAAEQLVTQSEGARRKELSETAAAAEDAEARAKKKAGEAPSDSPPSPPKGGESAPEVATPVATEEKAKGSDKGGATPAAKTKAAKPKATTPAKPAAPLTKEEKKAAAAKRAGITGKKGERVLSSKGKPMSSIKGAKIRLAALGESSEDFDFKDEPGGVVAVRKADKPKAAPKAAPKPKVGAEAAEELKKADEAGEVKAKPKEEAAPSGGKKWTVQIRGKGGAVRTVQVESTSKAGAVLEAGKLVKSGETVIPSSPTPEGGTTIEGKKTSMEEDIEFLERKKAEREARAKEGGEPAAQRPKPAEQKSSFQKILDAVEGAFANVTEDTDAEPLPDGADYQLDENGRLILRRELSPQKTVKALSQAMAEQASRKALSEEEGKALYAALPTPVKQLVKKRAKLKTKVEEVSDADAARHLVANLLTDKVLSATIRQQARGGQKKFVGMVLKFLRKFTTAIRDLMGKASPTVRAELQFYERYALAILKETTDAKALSDLGIALPATRLDSREDVVLPPNIQKKAKGYLVFLPNGPPVPAKTLQDARSLNATKWERNFMAEMRAALAVAITRGGLSIDELEGNLKLMKRMVETIAGKVSLSRETIYARLRARFAGGEFNGILNALEEGVSKGDIALQQEANAAIQERLAQLLNTNEAIDSVLENDSIPAAARRALAANRVSTDLSRDVAEGNTSAIESARAAQRRFLELAGRGGSRKVLSKIDDLHARKSELQDRLAGLAVEDMLLGDVPTKESKAITDEIADIDKQIEKAFGVVEKAYKRDVGQKTGVRGLETGAGEAHRLVAFTDAADASVVLHEFTHVFQSLRDPRTGTPLLEVALGPKGVKQMKKWISKVYPGAEEGDYRYNEALAEGMEAYLREGGKDDSELGDSFANIAAAIGSVYKGLKDRPGFKLNDDARSTLESLFSVDPVVSNSLNAAATRINALFTGLGGNISFVGDDMVLPLANGNRQVGAKKEKVAQRVADQLQRIYPDVRVANHGGKFYAVVSSPGLTFDTKKARMDMIASLSIAKGAELAAEYADLIRAANRSEGKFLGHVWPMLMRKAGNNLKPVLRNINRAAERAVADIASWIRENKEFTEYYDKDWRLARKIMRDTFPTSTADEMWMFQMLAGLTSGDTQLGENMIDAVWTFDHWLKERNFDAFERGKSPKNRPAVTKSPFTLRSSTGAQKVMSFKILEAKYKEFGSWKKVKDWMTEMVPMEEIQGFKLEWWSGKQRQGDQDAIAAVVREATGQDKLIPRAFMFGKKVGSYTLNNVGQFEFTTTDIWEGRFIRSYFPEMFDNSTGLPTGPEENTLFQRFATRFKERLDAELGQEISPAGLQAARWYYMLAKTKEAGYRGSRTNATISEYTAQAILNLRARNGGRPRSYRGPRGGSVQLSGRISGRIVGRSSRSLGDSFRAAYDGLVAVHEANGGLEKATSPKAGRQDIDRVVRKETAFLQKWAFARGLMFDSAAFVVPWAAQGKQGGSEHRVAFNERTKRVDKTTQAPLHDTWLQYFERLILHNELFPESTYEFLGFMQMPPGQGAGGGKGKLWAYVSQRAIRSKGRVDPEQVIVASARRGFVPIAEGLHYHPEIDVVVSDTWGDNVFAVGDGQVAFVDPIIRVRRGQRLKPEAYINDVLTKNGVPVPAMPEAILRDSAQRVYDDIKDRGFNTGQAMGMLRADEVARVQLSGSKEGAGDGDINDPKFKEWLAGFRKRLEEHAERMRLDAPDFEPGATIYTATGREMTYLAPAGRAKYGQGGKDIERKTIIAKWKDNEGHTVKGSVYLDAVVLDKPTREEALVAIVNERVATTEPRYRKGKIIMPGKDAMNPAQRLKMETSVSNFARNHAAHEYTQAEINDALAAKRLIDGYEDGDMVQLSGPKDSADGARRAAQRMRKGNKMGKWRKRDARDSAGKKVVKGDPSRANVASGQKARNAYDVSQEIYNENYVNQHWSDWEKDADAMLKNTSVNDIEKAIFQAAEGAAVDGNHNPGTPEFQIAAKRVVADRLQQAMTSGNRADIDYALALGQAEQEMRGEIARSMNAMRDPFKTPAQRAAYALGTAITMVPTGQANALKRKHGGGPGNPVPSGNKKAYDADMRKMQKARIEKAKAVLAHHGIDINDIFNAQGEGVAINSRLDNEAMAKLSDKQQQAVRMMREGAEPNAVKTATGLDEKAQKKAMEKFKAALEPGVRVLVGRGYTADTMDAYAKGYAPPGGTKSGDGNTKRTVEEIISRSFGTGKKAGEFNINDPRHVMAAARALGDLDLDWVTRSVGTWYANVFSSKTVMINLLSLPFAGYRAVAERGASAVINAIANNPDSKSFTEFKYMKRGLQAYWRMALQQAYIAFDTEHAYFHAFAKGEGDVLKRAAGETHEDVRGYQMGHILDYVDYALEKLGIDLQRPSLGRQAMGERGAKRGVKVGSAARGVLRFNLGADEFMRFLIAGQEVGAIAYRIGKARGLEGKALEEFIHNEMVVEGSSSWEQAAEEADISVFTQDLPSGWKNTPKNFSGLLAGVMNGLDRTFKDLEKSLRAEKEVFSVTTSGMTRLSKLARIDAMRAGIGLGRITLMPFTRVLMNLLQQGFKRVPNPFALAWVSAKVGIYAARRRGEVAPDIANAIDTMGTQIISHGLALFFLQALAGGEGDEDDRKKFFLITGSMPKFGAGAQELRAAAMREGMGPYRIRIGNTTFDYGRIDPLAITLGTTVDLMREIKLNISNQKTPWESGVTLLADTLAAQMTDKTMLRGMNDAFMMVSGRFKPQKWAARQFATFLVPNLFRQPLRDTNEFYDATVDDGSLESFADQLFYEMYPNAETKLGILPPSKHAPPAARDAYGKKKERPTTDNALFLPYSWIFRPQEYKPNRFDQMVRREQRRNPGDDSIKMPGDLSKTYTHTNPLTGVKEKHKLSAKQYEVLQRAYRARIMQETAGVIDAKGLTAAKRRASHDAWEIAKRNPVFASEAKKQSKRIK